MGTGASTGGIDLPLAREAATGWPVVPGSGLKGVLRGALGLPEATVTWLFGGSWNDTQDRDQGALMFSDLRLLCLPVRTYAGGWAWVTSAAALAAYRGEARWCLPAGDKLPGLPAAPPDEQCACAELSSPLKAGNAVYLHDLRLQVPDAAPQAAVLAQWAGHLAPAIFGQEQAAACAAFRARLVLVSEAALAYLGQVAMDVRTRVRLEARKAVAASGPWVEESLPVETVLWGSVAADAIQKADNEARNAQQAIDAFAQALGSERRLQLGGKATVGRGVVRLVKAAA
jgi:CRISPR-associated protein Cmr4